MGAIVSTIFSVIHYTLTSTLVSFPLWVFGIGCTILYLVLLAVQALMDKTMEVDLKKKYSASWGLVTGASSGIGKTIAEKLLTQGVNVVLVALDDKVLDGTFEELKKRFPQQTVKKVGCDMSRDGYMDAIIETTKDLPIQLVFNNAGFVSVGMFHKVALDRSMGNIECNALSAVKITHHFLNEMIKSDRKGFIGFTSSSAGFVPNPLSCMYASTKAFMTMFATSVAAEVKSKGIDITVVHPSPMATNFFDKGSGLGALMAFKKLANDPSIIADILFNSAGRFVVRDQGAVTILLRILLKAVDLNVFSELVVRFAHMSEDYVKFNKD